MKEWSPDYISRPNDSLLNEDAEITAQAPIITIKDLLSLVNDRHPEVYEPAKMPYCLTRAVEGKENEFIAITVAIRYRRSRIAGASAYTF